MQAVNKYTCGSSSAVRFELTKGLVSKTNQSLQTAQASVCSHRPLLVNDGRFLDAQSCSCILLFRISLENILLHEQNLKVLLVHEEKLQPALYCEVLQQR